MSEKEADGLMKSAKKHTEKTMLHWKPNHEGAAEDYEKAAKIYCQLHIRAKAIDAYTKAAEQHARAKSTFFAGRCLDALALYVADSAKEQHAQGGAAADSASLFTQLVAAAQYYEQAARAYYAGTKLTNQSESLNKASVLMSEFIAAESKKLPQQRNDAVLQNARMAYRQYVNESLSALELNWEVNEGTPFKLPELYKNFVLSSIRNNDFFSAIQAEKKMLGIVDKSALAAAAAPAPGSAESAPAAAAAPSFSVDREAYDESKDLFKRLRQPHNSAKVGLEIIVLILAFNSDYIWGQKEMEKLSAVPGFSGSPEEVCCSMLLQSYEDRDPDMLAETIKTRGNVLNFLLADVSRLAKKLKITTSSATAPAAGVVVPKGTDECRESPVKQQPQALPSAPQQQQQQEDAPAAEQDEDMDPEEDLR